MDAAELDDLKLTFQRALERWVRSIQYLEDVLAKTSHSSRAGDVWRQADFEQEVAGKAVEEAREAKLTNKLCERRTSIFSPFS